MKSRKELIYLNIKDLLPKEIETLADNDLNCCDHCGEIHQSEKLNWIDSEDFQNDEHCRRLLASGKIAICDKCYDIREEL